MKVLVAGAGWAGLAVAIKLTQSGHQVTLIEASRHLGGRARSLEVTLPNGQTSTLDNGQHILIGAYSETLRLMREVGVDLQDVLLRLPLTLRFLDGDALELPDWKNPPIKGLDVAWGIIQARGWSWSDKLSLLKAAAAWRIKGFECDAHSTVAQLCQGITPPVMQMLIEPLCVSALNTPSTSASGQVFLRILRDSLFAASTATEDFQSNSSNFLLPKTDLGQLFPEAAAAWLAKHGCEIRRGQRLTHITVNTTTSLSNSSHSLSKQEHSAHISCRVEPDLVQNFDQIVVATPPAEAARIARASGFNDWANTADALQYEAIATVYAYAPEAKLPCPIMALKSNEAAPAQFVFDRGQLTGHLGILAFVVSASQGDAATLEQKVIAQGRQQLHLPNLQPIQTIIDKRATFACTPGLQRPTAQIAPGITACGDYIQGPYPSTLEGAVRSAYTSADGWPALTNQ
ncbi:MAG: NAD(P)-binding protein [Brachymonas sp.]|nr:NAD(P)-binding protein [Brachymonas sp.]